MLLVENHGKGRLLVEAIYSHESNTANQLALFGINQVQETTLTFSIHASSCGTKFLTFV